MQWSLWFAGLMNSGPDDRMYDCLPMYHTLVGGVVRHRGVLSIRGRHKRDSATNIPQANAGTMSPGGTALIFQYIGELCRYLLGTTPPRQHRLRLACGNGLRTDVWEKFQEAFEIPRPLSSTAATAANFRISKVTSSAIGVARCHFLQEHRFPLAPGPPTMRAVDRQRDANRRCVRCAVGETGEAMGRIPNGAGDSAAAFEGYTDGVETERKILRDVFEPGDAWFRTGDLMKQDANGFFYFVDHVGDTFRWKGENVGPFRPVAAALTEFSRHHGQKPWFMVWPCQCIEGAAGMAAITAEGRLDLEGLRSHLASRLPAYAQPLFLRIQNSIATTATFKHQKSDLVRQGFDPAATPDFIYLNEPSRQAYVQFPTAPYSGASIDRTIRLWTRKACDCRPGNGLSGSERLLQ